VNSGKKYLVCISRSSSLELTQTLNLEPLNDF
jgi:hypothetical protein